ncbi:MAG: radical SAM protein [Bacteroidota bacterium]
MMPYPPLGTLYACAVARAAGFSVGLFDSMLAGSEQELRAVLQRDRPRVLVIYDDDFNYLTKMCLRRMRQAAFAMAAIGRAAGCRVVVHGSDPVDHLEDYAAHGADYVLCGEGERTLADLLRCLLRAQGDPEKTPGLAFLRDGAVHRTPARAVIKDLDSLPFPARDLLDLNRYRRAWSRHGRFSLNMVTTRGCPYHCNWCAKPLYGQVYNTRTPANVVDEMLHLRETARPDHLWFCDDIFGLKPGWVASFSEEVVRRQAVIPFKCLARADLLLREDAIGNLARAGCASVWMGAESGSQKILDAMEKGITVEQIRQAAQGLRAAGIRTGFFLQYGYPGETREDIDRTLAMVRTCLPDEIGISVSYPLPGTKFHETVRRQMGAKRNWEDSRDLAIMFAGTYPPDYYRILHRFTHKRFRIWHAGARLARRREILPEPPLRTLRALLSGAYHTATLSRVRRELVRLEQSPSG